MTLKAIIQELLRSYALNLTRCKRIFLKNFPPSLDAAQVRTLIDDFQKECMLKIDVADKMMQPGLVSRNYRSGY